jgi:hypothetical protein
MSESALIAEDAQYVELLWPIVPHGDIEGSLDWFTGVMALDVDYETWQNIGNATAELREHAVRVYSHELFHSLQIATMGFLHDWAADLFAMIRPVVARVQAGHAPKDFAAIKRLIARGSSLLTPAEQQEMLEHFRKIDRGGRSSLTTRAIFEGQAFFVERMLNYKIPDGGELVRHLAAAPRPVYRVAFDFLACATGLPAAFEWFSFVASMSLCTSDPVNTFERLAVALGAAFSAGELPTPADATDMGQFVKPFLDSADWSTPLAGVDKTHPVFSGTARALGEAEKQKLFDLFQFFRSPHNAINDMQQWSVPSVPIIFKPVPPTKLAIQVPPNMDETSVLVLFTIGAVGRQLTRAPAAQSAKEGDRNIDRLSWLISEHELMFYTLADEDVRSGDPGRMIKLFEPNDGAGPQKMTLWGRVVLGVSETIDPTGAAYLPQIPEARRLVSALHEKLPMFLLYLTPRFALYEWFGSVPTTLDANGQLKTDDPLVRRLVDEADAAMNEAAAAVGQNPWLAIHQLLGGFPGREVTL